MKTALIAGASGDIGGAIARRLAGDGWSLYLHYSSSRETAENLYRQLAGQYPEQDFFLLPCDFLVEEQTAALDQQIFALDAIVFAHGDSVYGLLQDTEMTELDRLWKLHVRSPVALVQRLLPKLRRSGLGRILFISSVYAEAGSSMEVFYSTVKGAQNAFVRAYSKEIASSGITVNAIAPGAVDTKMNRHYSAEERQQLVDEIPSGRLGDPEEIAYWARTVLSEEAGYLTGQILTVSGGWLL